MSAGSAVTIAGRGRAGGFTLGTVYAPRPGAGPGHPLKPRRLLGYAADSPLPGGRVRVSLPSGAQRVMTGTEWADWAGEPVGEVGR